MSVTAHRAYTDTRQTVLNIRPDVGIPLQKEQFCFCTTVPQLADVIRDLNPETLRPFPPSEPDRFGAYVDALMAS